jgi:hypothetical protein
LRTITSSAQDSGTVIANGIRDLTSGYVDKS